MRATRTRTASTRRAWASPQSAHPLPQCTADRHPRTALSRTLRRQRRTTPVRRENRRRKFSRRPTTPETWPKLSRLSTSAVPRSQRRAAYTRGPCTWTQRSSTPTGGTERSAGHSASHAACTSPPTCTHQPSVPTPASPSPVLCCAQPHRVAMFTLPIACVLPLELRQDAHLYQRGEYPYYSPYQLVSRSRRVPSPARRPLCPRVHSAELCSRPALRRLPHVAKRQSSAEAPQRAVSQRQRCSSPCSLLRTCAYPLSASTALRRHRPPVEERTFRCTPITRRSHSEQARPSSYSQAARAQDRQQRRAFITDQSVSTAAEREPGSPTAGVACRRSLHEHWITPGFELVQPPASGRLFIDARAT